MTIKEIAQMCNVSIATVSNVINGKNKAGDETARRVMEVIRETGYQPSYLAKGLRSQSTKMIGVIVEDLILFNVPDIIDGIMECCETNGYKIMLQNLRLYARWHGEWFDNERLYQSVLRPALKELGSINVDGMIYVAGHSHRMEDFEEDFALPSVVAYASSVSPRVPVFVLDDFQGGYDMAGYLVSKGHTRIGVIAGEANNLHTVNRLRGFQKGLYDRGILYDPDLTVHSRWEREGGYKAAPFVLKQGVSAVFCMSDSIAGGLYDYMRDKGIVVGRDVSVTGYDNQIMSAYMEPPLTTMQLPLVDLGMAAAQKLISILDGEETEKDFEKKLSCELIERKSVCALRSNEL